MGSFLKMIDKWCAEKMLDTELNTHGLGTHDRLSGLYVTVYWSIQYYLRVYIGVTCLNAFKDHGHAQSVLYTAMYTGVFFL